jgi:elongation factor G
MPRTIPLPSIRNFGIVAHVDAGKTTLTERVLYYTGRIHQMREVHDGAAHADHDPIEQRRGITIKAAAVTCDWQGHRLHLIDTPGHADFTIEVERSLRVLDGAVVVLDGVAGVEAQTETVWRQADRHGVPRLVFVNKLDRAGADFARGVADVAARLGARPVVVTAPLVEDGALVGVIDLVEGRALRWHGPRGDTVTAGPAPAPLCDNLQAAREHLLEVAADEDPAVLADVVDGRAPAADAVRAALRRATLAGRAVPVLAGAAYRNLGVQPLLDAIVAYLPSPPDRDDRDLDAAPLAALCFKTTFDDHGAMSFVRVYTGALVKGATVVSSRTGKRLRVGRLVQLVADTRHEVDRLDAGELGAVLGAPLATGETLADPDAPVALEAIALPEAVVRLAIEPATRDDRERLPVALARLVAADPSLRVETDGETGAAVLAGMGQLHLEIAVEKLATDHGVTVTAGRPSVAYRATLGRTVRRDVRHVKQSGGPGQFAHVVVELGPAPRGAGLVFEDRVRGGAIPRAFVRAVEAGIRAAMADGLVDGHPLVDVHAALLDGATHPKDSSELAFHVAGALALRGAVAEAAPVVLEPVMRLEVTCPEDAVGAVVGDLGRRRGQVLALDATGAARVVRGEVPLAETFGYAGVLSALTHGRGRFVLEPARLEPAPAGARGGGRAA